MRRTLAVAVLVTGALFACGTPRATQTDSCGTHFIPPPPPKPEIPATHETRFGTVLDTAYARRGVARLVFHVHSALNRDEVVALYAVIMRDSVIKDLPPLGSVADSTGVAVLKAVPVAYSSAHVRRIGYLSYTLPLVVRPGYTDTIIVALPRTPVCIVE